MYGSFEIHKRNCLVGLAMALVRSRARTGIYLLSDQNEDEEVFVAKMRPKATVGRCCFVMVAIGRETVGKIVDISGKKKISYKFTILRTSNPVGLKFRFS